MSWRPTTDFEEEIVSLQPDHNFIFAAEPEICYPRPKAHLEYAKAQREQRRQLSAKSGGNPKLKLIANIQQIAGTKKLGELPSLDDWNNSDNVERETIAMMRHFGYGPCLDQPLDERVTLGTIPVEKDTQTTSHGNKSMPVLFDEKYFELRPRYSAEMESQSSENNNECSAASTAHNEERKTRQQRAKETDTSNATTVDMQPLKAALNDAAELKLEPRRQSGKQKNKMERKANRTRRHQRPSDTDTSSSDVSSFGYKPLRGSRYMDITADSEEEYFSAKSNVTANGDSPQRSRSWRNSSNSSSDSNVSWRSGSGKNTSKVTAPLRLPTPPLSWRIREPNNSNDNGDESVDNDDSFVSASSLSCISEVPQVEPEFVKQSK